jgi:hypothetical protein
LLPTEDDKRRIGAARGQRSMLKAVATAPFQLVRSGASLVAGAAHDGVASPRSDAGGGVADQWCAALAILQSMHLDRPAYSWYNTCYSLLICAGVLMSVVLLAETHRSQSAGLTS